MKTRYTLLWIDDRKKEGFIDLADYQGFDIKHFTNSDAGMDYLRSNLNRVNGIILDAKVYKDAKDEAEKNDHLGGLQASLTSIAALKPPHDKIPWVIYSGQAGFLSNEATKELFPPEKTFDKSGDDDEVFHHLRKEIDNLPEATIREDYQVVFEACSPSLLGEALWEEFHPLLSHLKYDTPLIQNQQFNFIRQIVDQVFIVLKKQGVIHPELVPSSPKLTPISLFLSGKYISGSGLPSTQLDNPIFSRLMSEQLKLLLNIVQSGSHKRDQDEPETDIQFDLYQQEVADTHLIKTLTLIIVDLVKWMKSYLDQNPDVEENKSRWDQPISTSSLCEGEIASDDIWGNLYVKPDERQGFSESIRIHSSEVQRLSLVLGERVSLASEIMDGKSFRKGLPPITKL